MLQKDKKKTKYVLILLSLLVMNLAVFLDFNKIDNQDSGSEGKVRTSTSDPIIYVNDWAQAIIDEIATGHGTWSEPYVIEDLVIDGKKTTYCIQIENTDDYFEIRNCTLFNATSGILLQGVKNGTLTNNICHNNTYGIRLRSSSTNNTVINNTCYLNSNYGIGVYDSLENKFLNNNCSWNDYHGIFLDISSDHNNISDNDCFLNQYKGIKSYANHTFVSGNNCSFNDVGINTYGYNDIIQYNICLNSSWNGINFYSGNSTLVNNKCWFSDSIGINVFGQNNSIRNNNCSYNGYIGIQLDGSNNNTLAGNNCSFNDLLGIELEYSNKSLLVNNVCFFNYWDGIRLEYSHNNSVYRNNCSYNYNGVYTSESNNTIWFNCFIGNEGDTQVMSVNSTGTHWNKTGRGNYWGNYRERYPYAFGMGYVWNTSYHIDTWWDDPPAYDYYPLIDPNGEYKDVNFPTWNESLESIITGYYIPFEYDVNASDDVAIYQYWINDTETFQIDQDGVITNITLFTKSIYSLKISVNDTSGNEISEIINITVYGVPENQDDDGTTDDDGGGGGDGRGSGDDGTDDDSGEENGDDGGDSSDDDDGTDGGSNESIPGFPLVSLIISMIAVSALFSKKWLKKSL